MRPGPVVHGALLAAALGFAWQTWTRDRSVEPALATLTVWPAAGTVQSVTVHGKLRDVTVERRAEGAGGYYWASVTKRTPPPPAPKPAAAPDGGPPPNMSVMQPHGESKTTAFPVGAEGEKTLANLSPLKALRDLGKAGDKETYGLGDDSDKLTVKVGGATHELVLGAKVFGGDDRYVLDPQNGHVYVLAGAVLRPFDAPEFALRERHLHAFKPDEVTQVVLRGSVKGKERTLVRKAKGGAGEGPHLGPATWADAKSPDKPDQTLANFMTRVEQLAPTDYGQAPEPASLTPVATIEYHGKGGKTLGTVELSKRPASTPGQFEYYVKSERTHGLAKVSPRTAARVDQDLAQILP